MIKARKLDLQMPLKATHMGVGGKTTGPTTRPAVVVPPQLKAAQAGIKAENAGKNDAARARANQIGLTLQQIKRTYGEDAYKAAVRDFQADFRQFDKINLLRNRGPGIDPAVRLQPPPS